MKSSPAKAASKRRVDREARALVFELLAGLVEPLAEALGPGAEVVLHDMERVPNSVVAVAGSITGRGPGSPSTDVMLSEIRAGRFQHLIGYQSRSTDGRLLRSSSLFLRGTDGQPFGCLCINTDISGLAAARDLLASLSSTTDLMFLIDGPTGPGESETFPANVNDLAQSMLERAIATVGVPPELMRKAHKLSAVRELERQGFFQIREAVEVAAEALHVSRYTIYNYLNELGSAGANGGAEEGKGASGA